MPITLLRRHRPTIWLSCSAAALGAAMVIMGTGAVDPFAQAGPLTIESGRVVRHEALLGGDGLDNDDFDPTMALTQERGVDCPAGGSGWDVPAPDPERLVVSASIWFDTHSLEWYTLWPNNTSQPKPMTASVDWQWALIGNPYVFPEVPVLFGDGGHFSVQTVIQPGLRFRAEWWAPPRGANFTAATQPGTPSSLSQLLAMKKDGVLKLWFQTGYCNAMFNGKDANGYGLGGQPNTLYYQYSYGHRRPSDTLPPGPGKKMGLGESDHR